VISVKMDKEDLALIKNSNSNHPPALQNKEELELAL